MATNFRKFCLIALSTVCCGAQAAPVFVIQDFLTQASFGPTVAVLDGVVQAAANFWTTNLPTHPGFVRDVANNVTFNINIDEANNGANGPAETTAVPAGTANPAALPNNFIFHIEINTADAASMFWDATPNAQEEFNGTNTPGRFNAKAGGPADGKFDMFTVIEHEIAHVLAYNDYTDFESFVTNRWNPSPVTTKIALPIDHFIRGANLMSDAAALPGGKSGRVFAQPEDYLPLPEPSTLVLLLIPGMLLVFIARSPRHELTA